ncbi:MAG: hypothetical protein IT453_19835 [Planctomycetes bacterium]|nr:hypothetical protein [Planctomycetota bacterium]
MGFQIGEQACPPQFDIAALHDEIASVYGDAHADAIVADLGPGGSIGYGELFTPPDAHGVSDFDTILVNTKDVDGEQQLSEFEAAMIVAHEYEHVQNRRTQGGGHEDPTTGDPLCGPCNHASMHFAQASAILEMICGYPVSESKGPCEMVELDLIIGASHAYQGDSGCSPTLCPAGHFAMSGARAAATDTFDDCCAR